jgi:hypothetical protein
MLTVGRTTREVAMGTGDERTGTSVPETREHGSVRLDANGAAIISRRQVAIFGAGAAIAACAGADDDPAIDTSSKGIVRVSGGSGEQVEMTFADALGAANASAEPVTLVIDHLVEFSNPTPLTVEKHVTLRFEDGGQIKPTNGSQLFLEGPIEAVPEPARPLFDLSDEGIVEPRHRGTTYYANWWSSTEDGAGGDIGERWNNMVRYTRRNGGSHTSPTPRSYAVAGTHEYTTSLDLTGFGGVIFDFSLAALEYTGSDDVAIDMTLTSASVVNYLTLSGSGRIGLLVGRAQPRGFEDGVPQWDGGVSAHQDVFVDARISGNWEIAAFYNIAAEVNQIIGGDFANSHPNGEAVAYFGADKDHDFTGVHFWDKPRSVPLVPGNHFQAGEVDGNGNSLEGEERFSAVGQEIFGLRLRLASNKPGAAALKIVSFDKLAATNLHASAAGTDTRHVLLVVVQKEGIAGPALENFIGVGTPTYSIEFQGRLTPCETNVCIASEPYNPDCIAGFHLAGTRITAREIHSSVRDLFIGRVSLTQAFLSLPGSKGIECDEMAHLRDVHIDVSGHERAPVLLGKEFRGTIRMACIPSDPVVSQGFFRPASCYMEGTVIATASASEPTAAPCVRVYAPLDLEKNHLIMSDDKGVAWGMAGIRGNASSAESLAFTDNTGQTVASVHASEFRVDSGALGLMARASNPGAQPNEAVFWCSAESGSQGDLKVTIRTPSAVKTLKLAGFAQSTNNQCAVKGPC